MKHLRKGLLLALLILCLPLSACRPGLPLPTQPETISTRLPVTESPETEPPTTEPPTTQPPETQPPETEPTAPPPL